MSPSGDALRTRCRNYPGLINNTTVDWMFPWPQQALMAVANVHIRNVSKWTMKKCVRKYRINKYFLPEFDRTARIYGGNRESHGVHTHIRVTIHGGLCGKAEETKLRYAKTFLGLYQHLLEITNRKEEFHKFALRTSSRR